MEVFLKEKLESALWWNSSLFVVTQSEIKCRMFQQLNNYLFYNKTFKTDFPNTRDKIDTVLLATFDIATYTLFANASEEDSLDPIPQSRPKGSITIVDIIGDNLYIIDSTSCIHSISLDYAPLKFRMLVMAKNVDQALEWLPFIPEELHDYLVDFLVDRGFAIQAAKHIETMSPSKRLNLCLTYRLCVEGYAALQVVDSKHVLQCMLLLLLFKMLKCKSNRRTLE